jgi:amino acid adenylation domain-containing protein
VSNISKKTGFLKKQNLAVPPDRSIECQLSYWKKQLGGCLPILQLPIDYPRRSTQTDRFGQQTIEISQPLTVAIETLSQQEGVTLLVTLLATFQTLLYRYTDRSDIIVGTTAISSVDRIEAEYQLAIRTDLSGNPTFQELLARVFSVTLSAYKYQLPIEKIVADLQLESDPDRHPLFDVTIEFVNISATAFKLPERKITPELNRFESGTLLESKSALALYVQQRQQLELQLVYRQDLFSSDRIAILLDRFQFLLEQITLDPTRSIQSYSLISPQTGLLPDPYLPLPEPQLEPVTTLFTKWATQTPDRSAICQGASTWSYHQLSQSSQILAQMLVDRGIKQGDVVAITGERSFGLIAGMLGILASGGVLLTLDRNLPEQRRRLMLTTAEATILLDVSNHRTDKWIEGLEIILIDPNEATVGSSPPQSIAHSSLPIPAPDDPAYIFYTSGTTGTPKGVLGSHKGLDHFLNWQRQTFELQPTDRVAQITGLSFDVVLREIFLPLTSGATLCLPEPNADLAPAAIIPWLERQKISILHIVPSLAQIWIANLPESCSLETLRWIFFAGEPLTAKLVQQWRNCLPESSQIVNLYGPTETTLAKCYYQIPRDILPGVQPIGWPLPDTQALVFATTAACAPSFGGRLCEIGEPGEIVIRTPFRTLGYVNTTGADRQRFVKNPFRDDDRDLLYYTGDRGCYRADGTLEILGRIDRQVKIRGVRIELVEIEQAIDRHPDIRETVVICQENIHAEKYLVAYITFKPAQKPTQSELRHFLQQILPAYMMPSAFIYLDALPLTPNGKVDRAALPSPTTQQLRQAAAQPLIAPRDRLELQLTKIWEAVLGIQPIGVKDNFFEMGGNSLLAVRLVAQIKTEFQQDLPIAAIFQAPTIAELVKVLRAETTLAPWYSLVPIQPQGSRPILFGIHLFIFGDLSRHLGMDQPIYGLRYGISEPIDRQLSLPSLAELVAHYIAEMRNLQPTGPYFLMGLSAGGTVAYEMAQQLIAQGERVELLALFDTAIPEAKSSRRLYPLPQVLTNLWNLGLEELQLRARTTLTSRLQSWLIRWKLASPPDLTYYPSRDTDAPMYVLLQDYHPQPYSGKVLLFKALNLTKVSATSYIDPLDVRFRKLVAEKLAVVEVPGSHTGILVDPHAQLLADQLKEYIDRFLADRPTS